MTQVRQFFWQAMQKLSLAKPKKHHFQGAVDAFIERVQRFPGTRRRVVTRGGVGVLVTPWMQTAVPLFSLEIARKLAAEGQSVTLLWDSTNCFGNAANAWEIEQLERVMAALREEFEIIRVDESLPASGTEPAFFAEFVFENAVQKTRGEKHAAEFLADNPALVTSLRSHASRVSELLRARPLDWLFIPGGVWASSGIYGQVATALGIAITTYDCGPGALYLAHGGPAAQFPEVAVVTREVELACQGDERERQRLRAAVQARLEGRMRGHDEYRLQPVEASASAGQSWDLVVPLNLRWDSAALCRRRLFASVKDWLQHLLAWVEKTPGVTVALRQHPCERLADLRGADDFQTLLNDFPKLGERARFFAAEEPVNTYDLLAGARVILPFTSRVGIEAALFGKPAILSAHCYYGDCGFAAAPASQDEYFALLAQALAGELPVSEEARFAANIAYYLAEECLEMKTPFTPAPTDYANWVRQSPDEIWNSPETQDLLRALITREPLVRIRYERQAGRTTTPHRASVS